MQLTSRPIPDWRKLALFPLLLASACVIMRTAPRRPLSRQEAVDVAVNEAARQGYRTRFVEQVDRDDAEWNVLLRLAPPPRGDVRVRVDAWSGAIDRFDARLQRERREHEDDGEHGGEHEHRNHRDHDDG
jgi:hypothetical protein